MPYNDHFYDPPNFPDKVTRILAADPALVVYARFDEGFDFVRELRGDPVSGPTAIYRAIGGTFVYQTSVR